MALLRISRTARRSVRPPLCLRHVLPLLLLFGTTELAAQAMRRGDRVTVRAGTALRSTPGGEVIGVSSRPITAPIELMQSTFVRVTLDGFVSASDVTVNAGRTRGEVSTARGTTLRAAGRANGAAVAELRRSAYVFPMRAGGRFPAARAGAFIPARRSLWVDVSRVTTGGATAVVTESAAPAEEPTGEQRSGPEDSAASEPAAAATPLSEPVSGPMLETQSPATLRTGPGGDALASIPGGVPVISLARENGWVRVRIEGWLPDSTVDAAGARSAGALTAADLRANPVGTVGRLVRWSVEALAFQTADELRRGLNPGEPYLLARGPGAERAVLYLAVPDSLVGVAQALPPLAELSITARVRTGRSLPAGVPILDLLELTRR